MANEALAQLKDIHLPSPISWWPLAPGWYVLFALLLFLFIILSYFISKKRQQAKAKKEALKLLKSYKIAYDKTHNSQEASAEISKLLKRVALAYYPRALVASLHGLAWLKFLSEHSKGINFQAIQPLLLDAPFKPSESMDLNPLFKGAELWIKQRRRPCLN